MNENEPWDFKSNDTMNLMPWLIQKTPYFYFIGSFLEIYEEKVMHASLRLNPPVD